MIVKFIPSLPILLLISLSANLYAGLPSNEKLEAVRNEGLKLMANYFSVKNGSGKCMTVDRAELRKHGAQVKTFNCSNAGNQKWTLDGARVKVASGMCLQPSGDGTKAGEILQIANCDNSAKQNWKYENTLLKTSANLCVEIIPAELAKEGGTIHLSTCNGQAHQQWTPN